MSRTRNFLTLAAVALAFLASAANAQTISASNTAGITYTKLSEIVPPSTLTVTGSTDSVTYTVGAPGASWLSASCGAPPCTAGTGDVPGPTGTVTFSVVPSVADAMAGGSYNTTVVLQVGGVTQVTVTVTLTLTANATPLATAVAQPIPLTYILNGVANQASAKATATITDNDTLPDSYAISGVPGWLTVVATHGSASLTANDTLTFSVNQNGANGLSANPPNASVVLTVANNPTLTITVSLTLIPQQPLVTASTVAPFGFTIGGAATNPVSGTAAITVASGSMTFNLDPATVPAWLTATATGTASTTPTTVTFTPVLAVIKALAAGNYTASIGYEAVGAEHELLIPVTLTVSNPTATVSIQGHATNPAILNYPAPPGLAPAIPAPVVTVLSSDEPTGFTAACSVSSTYPAYVPSQPPCQMTGASAEAATVTGIAYTYGTPLTVVFDPALFASPGVLPSGTPFGTVVTVTVSVTAGVQPAVTQSYAYTIQPIAPTFTAVSPTSASVVGSGDSLVVTLTGTNFVGPNQILGGNAISPTKVWVGTNDLTTPVPSVITVLNGTTIMVSVPAADYPTLTAGKGTMVIGVANQIAGAAPLQSTAVTQDLAITTNPVVYAVTSTATYLQPNPGTKPSVAPYELISIFGANFGAFSAPGYATGALSAYNQFGDTVNVSGAGTPSSPYVTLGVTFKIGATTYKAPILYANASQINCIVPSSLTVGPTTAFVTVTSGANSSDGLFGVSVVATQPGIFTLASDGVGQGAILNANYSVNGSTSPAHAGDTVSIYVTGLGAPNSAAVDNAANTGGVYPTNCVIISGTTTGSPGYMQVLNSSNPHLTPPYTAPATPFANIDGVAIEPEFLLGTNTDNGTGALPPCIVNSGNTAMSVSLGGTPATIGYAGFVSGSVAGLYQINATIPADFASTGNIPITVSIGSGVNPPTSPAGVVTIAIH